MAQHTRGGGRPGGGYGGAPGRGRDGPVAASIDVGAVSFQEKPAADLFSDVAERAAKHVADVQRKNKPSQLRRFYDELVMWQEKVGSSPERFSEAEPYIRMLKAKVAYACGREHVDENFRALFARVVDEAKDHARLRQAKLFMEAFMAYYKVYRPRES